MKVAVVTGSSKGIGKAIADAFTAAGYAVEGISRSGPSPVDVRDKYQVYRFMKMIAKHHGRLDVLINNAGYAHRRLPIQNVTRTDLYNSFETNTFGPFYMMRAAIPIMKKQNHGVIINISSMAALNASRGYSAYAASKAALITLTRVAARETEENNILCVSVCPGATNMAMRAASHGAEDAAKQQSPEVIAKVVMNIVKRKAIDGFRRVNTGEIVAVVDGKASVVSIPAVF